MRDVRACVRDRVRVRARERKSERASERERDREEKSREEERRARRECNLIACNTVEPVRLSGRPAPAAARTLLDSESIGPAKVKMRWG